MMYLNDVMEEIITFDGTPALRRNCRFIKGAFYVKNKQCFLIDGKWYRANSNYVLFDYEIQSWVLKEGNRLTHGIINISKESTLEFGHFSPNLVQNIRFFYHGKLYVAINLEIFRNSTIIEGLTGVYYFYGENPLPREFTQKQKPHKEGCYSFPFLYGSDELIPRFNTVFRKSFWGSPLISNAYKYLGDYTFGIEFETERGTIPEKFLEVNGLIPLRDGSISGFEYTTIPLHGEEGIQAIKKQCELLKKYCSCSPNESLHIHIGGYPKTIKAISSLYRVSLLLQKEVYQMFPYFYKNTADFKRKGYCNPLYIVGANSTNATEIFSEIYAKLTNGAKFNKFPTGLHPLDRQGDHKWDVSPRYVWENLIPIIWGNRGTVEFRCHTPTVNAQKVINWLFILVAILKYAHKHQSLMVSMVQSDLPKLSLQKILEEFYPINIVDILSEYIEERKDHYSGENDCTGEHEIFSEEREEKLFTLTPFV